MRKEETEEGGRRTDGGRKEDGGRMEGGRIERMENKRRTEEVTKVFHLNQ